MHVNFFFRYKKKDGGLAAILFPNLMLKRIVSGSVDKNSTQLDGNNSLTFRTLLKYTWEIIHIKYFFQ